MIRKQLHSLRSEMPTPRLEIDLAKIHHNTRFLSNLFKSKGIAIMGITKVMLGDPQVAQTLVQAGADLLGDSRIENIRRMRESGVEARFALIRSPLLSQVDQVVQYADISVNSELLIIQKLSQAASRQKKSHKVILMVELGDLREGLLPENLELTVQKVLNLPGIELAGLGTNLGCFGGIIPSGVQMDQLSHLVEAVEARFDLRLDMVSGGSSANYNWFMQNKDVGRINNLRIGETIFLGHNILGYTPIEGLCRDAVTLVAEVIECKEKESIPYGGVGKNAFGQIPSFTNRGRMNRAILGLGRQDVITDGIIPVADIEVLGSSSDHAIVNVKKLPVKVGDEFRFRLSYGALLSSMTSPYVGKVFLNPMAQLQS